MNALRLARSLVLLFALCTAPANAAKEFTIADLDDDEIHDLVAGLIGFAEDYAADEVRGIVYLDRSHYVEARAREYSIGHSSVLHVLESMDEDEATRRIELQAGEDVVRAGAWVVRSNGALRRLGDADVRVDEAGEDGPSQVVFGFPRLEPGDTLGLSVLARSEDPLFLRLLPIDADVPVAYGRFILQTDGTVGYTVRASNVSRDDFSIETGAEKNGNPSRVECTYRALEADRDDPLGLPWRSRRAHVRVNYKGSFDEELGLWTAWKSWNRVALAMDETLREIVEPTGDVRDRAEELVAGIADAGARRDALFRYVRDDIVTLELGESLEFTKAEDVLDDRAGDTFDKAALLVALLRSQNVPARLGFARGRHLGEIAHRDPGFWQFSDAVVLVGQPGGVDTTWYAPGTDGCPARILPPELRGVEVVFFDEDLDDRNRRVWQRALSEDGGVRRRLVMKYLQLIRAADWTTVVKTEGDADEIVGIVHETRALDPRAGTGRVDLVAEGITGPGNHARSGATPDEVVLRYCDDRGLDPKGISEVSLRVEGDDERIACTWEESITGIVLTPDTWILPSDVVFGRPFLDFWTGGDRGPVYVSYSRQRTLRSEISIPEGWSLAEPVHPFEIVNPLFRYAREVWIEDGTLIVERVLAMRAGRLGRQSLPMLDGDVEKIALHESEDLVVLAPEAPGLDASSTN